MMELGMLTSGAGDLTMDHYNLMMEQLHHKPASKDPWTVLYTMLSNFPSIQYLTWIEFLSHIHVTC